ncbi:MAG: class I SAM-dependent methyltransferase [Deltaproteobacteria bacterium]|nr:class I SAM-dependent methyltransferase [Deltaproteobacteria bacterium]
MVKPASKVRLARHATDHFLLQVAAEVKPGAIVLDAGAGNCKHKNFSPHARYLAFDMKPVKKRAYGDVDLAANLYHLPFRSNSIPAAINVDVIEHLREPLAALKEFARVLEPGGKLFLIAPQGWQEHGMPNDYFRFTSSGIRYLSEQAGLEPVSIAPMGGFFWYLGHRVSLSYRYLFPNKRRALWKILDAPIRHPARLFCALSFLTRATI